MELQPFGEFYPNPVDQMLNIAAAAAIERIMVYGISGTRVACI